MKVVVIGGGAIGLACAWELARRGARVRLLERGRPGRESSWAAGGMLAPIAEAEFTGEARLHFHLASLEAWPAFAEAVGDDAGEALALERSGTLNVALTPYDASLLERRFAFQRKLGLAVEWLDGPALRRLEPLLSPNLRAGAWSELECYVDPRQVVERLAAAARRRGVEIHEETPVERFEVEGDRVGAVRAGGERHEADRFVLAAGAWSGEIEGLPDAERPPVRPVRGQIVLLRADAPPIARPVRGKGAYLVPRPDGRLLVGATVEEQGFDKRVTAEGVRLLLEGAFEILPATAEMEVADLWAGLRPASRDEGPILGAGGLPNLIHASGHHRNGILDLPATVEAVGAAVYDRALPEVARPFAPGRFRRRPEPETTAAEEKTA